MVTIYSVGLKFIYLTTNPCKLHELSYVMPFETQLSDSKMVSPYTSKPGYKKHVNTHQ